MSSISNVGPPAETPVRDGPVGIGGWLILPIIGLVFTPISGLMQLGAYPGLADSFALLTPAQKTFLVIEIVGNFVLMLALPIVLLVLLFRKKASFPRIYVVWAIFNAVFLVGDLVAAKALFGDVFAAQEIELIDSDTLKAIIRAAALVVIWIPYMRMSKRVRNTFVN